MWLSVVSDADNQRSLQRQLVAEEREGPHLCAGHLLNGLGRRRSGGNDRVAPTVGRHVRRYLRQCTCQHVTVHVTVRVTVRNELIDSAGRLTVQRSWCMLAFVAETLQDSLLWRSALAENARDFVTADVTCSVTSRAQRDVTHRMHDVMWRQNG